MRLASQRDQPPYENGYLAGMGHLMATEDPDEDAYYRGLSETDRAEYDLGWIDGYSGAPRRGERLVEETGE